MRAARRWGGRVAALCVTLVVIGAAEARPPRTRPVTWDDLPGWSRDNHAGAWPALLRSCQAVGGRSRAWRSVCERATKMNVPTDAEARAFFERYFTPHRVLGPKDAPTGMVTGYYDPLLRGSLQRTSKFRYPIYRDPGGAIGRLSPREAPQALRTLSRAEIDGPARPLAGHEIVWVDDPIGRYFMHVEGSGKVQLPDGRVLALDYDGQNKRKFRPVGKELVDRGVLPREAVTLDAIRDWLAAHPAEVDDILDNDPSYVFFKVRPSPEHGPLGALGIELSPERSIAVDPSFVPLGVPVWLDTEHPLNTGTPYRRLVLAQDTGGAIRGPLRVDLYWGEGRQAERLAGNTKGRGVMFVLLPRES
jgi:membrane-bound lytic murein transglycosylase A